MTERAHIRPEELGLCHFLGGQFALAGIGEQHGVLEVDERKLPDGSWRLPTGSLSGCGAIRAHVDKKGWSVFAIGERAEPAKVAKVLETAENWDRPSWNGEIGGRHAEKLFWATFPGMAAVAVHSEGNVSCLLRDPLGYLPLYYTVREGVLTVSTSLLWLKRQTGVNIVDRGKIAELLLFEQHYGRRTVWDDVRTVFPGSFVVHSWQFRGGHCISFAGPEAVMDQPLRDSISAMPIPELLTRVRKLTSASLDRAMNCSQFVIQGGGGVDSSVIIAMAAQKGKKFDVWSINHGDLTVSESQWTEPLLSKLQITSRVADVNRDKFVRQFVEMSRRSCQPLVGPNFIGGGILRKSAVSGASPELTFINGGMCDTIFGGLSSFNQLARWRRAAAGLAKLPASVRQWIARGVLGESHLFATRMLTMSHESLASIAYGSGERLELLEELKGIGSSGRMTAQDVADKLSWLDFRKGASALHHGYFERGEWYGGRWEFPFLDEELFRFAFNLPHYLKFRHGWTKWLWRKLAADLVGKDIAFRRKHGFDAPIRRWFPNIEKELCTGFVADLLGGLSRKTMENLMRENSLFWTILNVEVWGRLHCWNEDVDGLTERLLEG